MSKYQVVHVEAVSGDALPIEQAMLAGAGAQLTGAHTSDPNCIIAAAQDADVLLTECSTVITRHVLENLPRCQAVVLYAIGLDHVDLEAATEQGIIVAHTPGFCVDEVANHTIMFILACARRLLALDRHLRRGWWPDILNLEADLTPMGCLRGERLGLLSFGAIARAVAAKAQAFELQVCAYDPFLEQSIFAQYGVEAATLEAVVATSDYLSIHTPQTPATRHLIGERELQRMKPSAFLINTSRGAVVDETALIRALQEGWLAGAALDVFEQEPPTPNNPLLQMESVIVTPHTAYCSGAAYGHVRQMAAAETVRILSGHWPVALANPQVKGRARMEQWRGTQGKPA